MGKGNSYILVLQETAPCELVTKMQPENNVFIIHMGSGYLRAFLSKGILHFTRAIYTKEQAYVGTDWTACREDSSRRHPWRI